MCFDSVYRIDFFVAGVGGENERYFYLKIYRLMGFDECLFGLFLGRVMAAELLFFGRDISPLPYGVER